MKSSSCLQSLGRVCVLAYFFFFAASVPKDLLGDLEASFQKDDSSRCGGRVDWFQDTGAGGGG